MIIEIEKETDFNKALKQQKANKDKIYVLYHSLWDKLSKSLVENLKDKGTNKTIYLVNSFDTPHSFVIHGITKAPALVKITDKGYKVEDKLPAIYYSLGLKDLPSVKDN